MIAIFFLSINFCNAQKAGKIPLSIPEINQLISLVDTSGVDNNYHLMFNEGWSEKTVIVNIWINDKLGDTMFQDVGINICEFYPYKNGYVFIYQSNSCIEDIPVDFLIKYDDQSHLYLNESPFYTENGLHKMVLVEKKTDNVLYFDLKLLNEDEELDGIEKQFEDLH